MEGSPNLGLPLLLLEGDNASDVSMVDDSLLHCDSDMVIKEEREESMDTDVPSSPAAPHTPEGEVHVRRLRGWGTPMTTVVTHQKIVPIKTYPMTLILMKMSFWGQ